MNMQGPLGNAYVTPPRGNPPPSFSASHYDNVAAGGHARIPPSSSIGPASRETYAYSPQQGFGAVGDFAGVDLADVSALLESAEEARSLRQARVATKIKAQVRNVDGKPLPPGSSMRPSFKRSSSRWWESNDYQRETIDMDRMYAMVSEFCSSKEAPKPLDAAFVGQLLDEAEKTHRRSRHETITRLQMPSTTQGGAAPSRVVIVGDTHGQLEDVLWIFHKYGLPSPSNVYLFNGDIADRGNKALEIFMLVLGFMIACPECMFFNRGNHEDDMMNHSGCGGFYNECLSKYGRSIGGLVYEQFRRIFAILPLATILDNSVFIIHGGIARRPHFIQLLDGIHERPSTLPTDPHTAQEIALVDALWSDPSDKPGWSPSTRGGGLVTFGPDVTSAFLQEFSCALNA